MLNMLNKIKNHFREVAGYLLKGAGITIVGALIAFVAVLSSTILPFYFSSDSSDFSILIQPANIEANQLGSELSPLMLQIWSSPLSKNETKLQSKPAIIKVQNVHDMVSPYKQSVYLSPAPYDSRIEVEIENDTGLPNFQAKMYVYVKPTNKSIVHLPIIIRGIGGNGKIRNCTCYVTYITPEDYVRKGKNLSLQARYDEAVRSYDKAIDVDPTFESLGATKVGPLLLLESITTLL